MSPLEKRKIGSGSISLFVILVYLAASGWIRELLFENSIIAGVLLINTIVVTLYYFQPSKFPTKFLILSYCLLVIFQFKTTNIDDTYTFTPSQVDMQITRMNHYPPSLAKLGYILENKREVKILEKVKENFIEVVDIKQYFPNYFSYLSLPLFLYGVFLFVKKSTSAKNKDRQKTLNILLIFSVFALSIVGVRGKYGPFLIFHFILFFIYHGLFDLLKKAKLYEQKD